MRFGIIGAERCVGTTQPRAREHALQGFGEMIDKPWPNDWLIINHMVAVYAGIGTIAVLLVALAICL